MIDTSMLVSLYNIAAAKPSPLTPEQAGVLRVYDYGFEQGMKYAQELAEKKRD